MLLEPFHHLLNPGAIIHMRLWNIDICIPPVPIQRDTPDIHAKRPVKPCHQLRRDRRVEAANSIGKLYRHEIEALQVHNTVGIAHNVAILNMQPRESIARARSGNATIIKHITYWQARNGA